MTVAIASAAAPSQPGTGRYPKRKRAAVSYNEADSLGDDLFGSDDEGIDDDFGAPQTKKRKPAAKKKPRQKAFPFLSLPAELRNKIYQLALLKHNGIYIYNTRNGLRRSCIWGGKSNVHIPKPPAVGLLATCKAVYAETAAMLYGQRFKIEDNRALLTFLSLMRPQTTALLRHVVVREWNSGRTFSSMNVPAMALLSHATGLDRLCIGTDLMGYKRDYWWWTREKSKSMGVCLARKVFRDCYPLLYAIQRQRGLAAVLEVVGLADCNFGDHKERHAQLHSADLQGNSEAEQKANRRRRFEQELGRLLGHDAAEVEAIRASSDAQVCA